MAKQIQSWCAAVLLIVCYSFAVAAKTSSQQNTTNQVPYKPPKAPKKPTPVKLKPLKPLSEKDIQKANDAYVGELTDSGAKELLSFRRGRNGGDGPTVTNPKGSVKFWVKDGVLTKYEFHLQGSVSFNGNDIDVDRTTTVEIKDVGSTKITIPDGAAKKMSS